MKKIFLNQKMSYLKVVVFAVITAVVTAVLKLLPFLENTSFQDIAISYECWFLFALYIIMNCKKPLEASVKTFVFFLISQPLIYLIQVPFSDLGFGLFGYYKYWFIITLLTLPGAAVAFLVKKKNILSALVLSVATCFISYIAADYFRRVKAHFPYHIISFVFCIFLVVFFAVTFLNKKSFRILVFVLSLLAFSTSLFVLKPDDLQTIELPEGNWEYTAETPDICSIKMTDSDTAQITAENEGTSLITFTSENGEKEEYLITVSGGSITINQFD